MAEHDPESIWTVLASTPRANADQLIVAIAGRLVDGREVLAGLDRIGNRHVLVPLLPPEQFGAIGAGRAVQLRVVELPRGRYASAVCVDRRLDDVFAQFARELTESIFTSGKPARDMRGSYSRWRALFSEPSSAVLSKQEEVGLLGELLFLKELLERGGKCAVWKGPDKSSHDFRSGIAHVEVKTTLMREGLKVSIHGVEQLAAPPGETLHLATYRLDESDSGFSLISTIRAVESIVDDDEKFEAQLRAAGFRWEHSSSYEATYRLAGSLTFDVLVPGFPRIVGDSFRGGEMPEGTLELSYSLNLGGPTPVPLDSKAREAVLSAMVGK